MLNSLLNLFLSHNVDSIVSALNKIIARLERAQAIHTAKAQAAADRADKALKAVKVAQDEVLRASRVAAKVKEIVS